MNPDRIARNQLLNFARLLARLQTHVRNDPHLPSRIKELLDRNRAFGSRDRRLYRELIYTAVRFWPWYESLRAADGDLAVAAMVWLAGDTPATQKFHPEALKDWPATPATLVEKARVLSARTGVPLAPRDLLPPWFTLHGPAVFDPAQLEVMLNRAVFWVRLQTTDPVPVFAEFAERGVHYQQSSVLAAAVKVFTESDLTQTESHQRGLLEIQDLGSQLILEIVAPAPGGRWLDACAGAGGKTLQLARFVGPRGIVEATDIRPEALRELSKRVSRAGLKNVKVLRAGAPVSGPYDGVLVDAPCSGSGTWRRAPHLKWLTTPEDVQAAAQRQQTILSAQASLVRPGGLLVYATCSLSRLENQEVIRTFLATHHEFGVSPLARTFGFIPEDMGLTIWPASHNTDGYFVTALRRLR